MSNSAADGGPRDQDLPEKLLAWLQSEGYPLEFATADALRSAGFNVLQGEYTRPTESESRRELDVVAQISRSAAGQLLRVEHVIECKWSADKPWVLFGSDRSMSTAACVSQSMGTRLAETLLWKEAGNDDFSDLQIFGSDGENLAYGGRQAFSGSKDQVFDAIRAVTASCRKLADEYDERTEYDLAAGGLPKHVVVVFPVIVVEGRLFRTTRMADEPGLEEISSARIHWRGSDRHRLPHATLDVVRADQMERFARQRVTDSEVILDVMSSALDELRTCVAAGRLEDLAVTRGSRGMVGTPRLIGELRHRLQSGAKGLAGGSDKGEPS
jgi:hypothetical protein